MKLPDSLTIPEFIRNFRTHFDLWSEAVRELCIQHSIELGDLVPYTDGSNLIASVSAEAIVKIFPPFHRHQWQSEWQVLQHLAPVPLSIPTPKLLAFGERSDGWTYVIISKVAGKSLEIVWPTLSLPEKTSLLQEIGMLMAHVHSIPVGSLQNLPPDWNTFLQDQKVKAPARHQGLGMPDWFLAELPAFIDSVFSNFPCEKPVILTGEYTPFNLLVHQSVGQWTLAGMIDFGDAMIGNREYDFLGPLLFLCEGQPAFVEALFHGYGYPQPKADSALRDRLLLLAILHRYSDLKRQIRIEGWLNRMNSLRELQNLLLPR